MFEFLKPGGSPPVSLESVVEPPAITSTDAVPASAPTAPAPITVSTRMPVVNDQYGKAIDGVVSFLAIIKATDPKPIRSKQDVVDEIQRTDDDRKKRATLIATAQRNTDPTKIFVSEQYQLVVYDDHPALTGIDMNTCDFASLLMSFDEDLLKVDGGTRHLAHRWVIEGAKKGKKQVAEARPEFLHAPVKVCLHIVERGAGLFMKMFQNFNSDRTKISKGLMDLIKAYGFVWEEQRAEVLEGVEANESNERLQDTRKHYVITLLADPQIPQFRGMISRPNEIEEEGAVKKLPFERVAASIDACITTAKWCEGQFSHEFNALPSDKLIKIFRTVIVFTNQATGDWIFGEEEFKKWIKGAFATVFTMNVTAPMYLIRKIYDREKSMDDSYTINEAVASIWKYYQPITAALEAERERASDRYHGRTTSGAKGEAWEKIKNDLDNIRLGDIRP